MRGYWFGTSSIDAVLVQPSDIKRETVKQESDMRTRDGKLYRAFLGGRQVYKGKLTFISSSDACRINSWWRDDSDLVFWESHDGGLALGDSGYTLHPMPQTFDPTAMGLLFKLTPNWGADSATRGLWQTTDVLSDGFVAHKHEFYYDQDNYFKLRVSDVSTFHELVFSADITSGSPIDLVIGFGNTALTAYARGTLVASEAMLLSENSMTVIDSQFVLGNAHGAPANCTLRHVVLHLGGPHAEDATDFHNTGTTTDNENLIAEFEFDDNAVDISGNGAHGTIFNVESYGNVLTSVRFANKSLPLDQRMHPDDSLFQGTIELEEV